MTDLEKLGAILRELRGERTLRELALALGLSSPQTVGNWERGYQVPPDAKITEIRAAYNFSANAEKAEEFERLYSDIRKQKSSAGPITLDDQGVAPMVRGLRQLAETARADTEHRYILHSVSNQSFLTESVPDLQAAVFECAEAGVDVVFFPQPGTETPDAVRQDLVKSLKRGVENYKQARKAKAPTVDRAAVFGRFWMLKHLYSPPTFPLPAVEDDLNEWCNNFVKELNGESSPEKAKKISGLVQCVGAAASWLGSFLRFLVELKIPKSDKKMTPLEQICPDEFDLERMWLHFVTYNADTNVKNHAWLHIPDESGRFAIEYGRELAVRKDAGLLVALPLFET